MTNPKSIEIRRVASPPGDHAIENLRRRDILRRKRYGRHAENDFDHEWVAVFQLLRGGEIIGGIRFEAARLLTLLPAGDEKWQHYRFGGIVEFPLVDGDDVAMVQDWQRKLLETVQAHAGIACPGIPLFCLLRQGDSAPAALLEDLGFVRSKEDCIDHKLLGERGFVARSVGRGLVYRFDPPATAEELATPTAFNPIALLTEDDENLRIFSNQETKVRLVPTLEFWSAVKPYTTFSAYPLIRSFLRRFLARLALASEPRLLIAPCGAGDFLRFWPPEQPVAKAVGVDIRNDLLNLARLRLAHPQIDQVNLALCQLLSGIVAENRVRADAEVRIANVANLLAPAGRNARQRDLASPAALRVFARFFDEVLRNHAVPDWYMPIKVLAASLGVEDSIRVDRLTRWLDTHSESLAVAAHLDELQHQDDLSASIRESGRPGIDVIQSEFIAADLTKSETLAGQRFDIVLCWEFIHVFHSSEEIDQFLSMLVSRVDHGGGILITCIREAEPIEPQELLWALQFFRRRQLDVEVVKMYFGAEPVPFPERLRYYYPVLIVSS